MKKLQELWKKWENTDMTSKTLMKNAFQLGVESGKEERGEKCHVCGNGSYGPPHHIIGCSNSKPTPSPVKRIEEISREELCTACDKDRIRVAFVPALLGDKINELIRKVNAT